MGAVLSRAHKNTRRTNRARRRTGGPRHVVMIRPSFGGVAHVARSCAEELRGQGVGVTELVGSETGSPAVQSARLVWSQRARIRAADVVHVEVGSTALSTFWVALWSTLLRGDLVMVVHDGPRLVLAPGSGLVETRAGVRDALAHKVFARLLDRPLRALIIRRTGVWVTLSERARREVERAGLGPVVAIPHGADPPTSSAPPSRCDTVVFAGFIGPAKGLDILLDAWERIGPACNLRLLIVGGYGRRESSYAEALRARLEALGPTATWRGSVAGDDEFNAAIAEAAIVVIPYRSSNPLSGILIRALVEGRAVIGSSVPAVTDFVVDGVTGLVTKTHDPGELADALDRLASDLRARDELGAASARWAGAHCTWTQQVAELQGAYARARTA